MSVADNQNSQTAGRGGPVPIWAPLEVHGLRGSHAPDRHPEDDDFGQAGALYRLMSEPDKQRLADNIAGSLGQVSEEDIIERSIAHFPKADPDYGECVAKAVATKRSAL